MVVSFGAICVILVNQILPVRLHLIKIDGNDLCVLGLVLASNLHFGCFFLVLLSFRKVAAAVV